MPGGLGLWIRQCHRVTHARFSYNPSYHTELIGISNETSSNPMQVDTKTSVGVVLQSLFAQRAFALDDNC